MIHHRSAPEPQGELVEVRDHVRAGDEERHDEDPEHDQDGRDRALDEALACVEQASYLIRGHRSPPADGSASIVGWVEWPVAGSTRWRRRGPARSVARAATGDRGHRRAGVDGVAAEAAAGLAPGDRRVEADLVGPEASRIDHRQRRHGPAVAARGRAARLVLGRRPVADRGQDRRLAVARRPARYSWIAPAARRPAATASMIVFGPVTTSPPAKTPRRPVARVRGSAAIPAQALVSMPAPSGRIEGSGSSPMATRMTSASITASEPGTGAQTARPPSTAPVGRLLGDPEPADPALARRRPRRSRPRSGTRRPRVEPPRPPRPGRASP